MAWTNLTFAFGSLLTAAKMTQLDDNFDALASGASGAPTIDTAAITSLAVTAAKIATGTITVTQMGAASVARSELKTSLATSAGSINNNNAVAFTLNNYALFPNISSEAHAVGSMGLVGGNDGGSGAVPGFQMWNTSGSAKTYDVDHRYVAA